MATDNKYDRQLRLWGAAGQERLATAHILLLKAGPTGTEALKNLVLPGIGQFTVVDDAVVTNADVSNNFFLPADQVGKSRSEVACSLLGELNPDVKGHAVTLDPIEYVQAGNLSKGFTLVIATELATHDLVKVEIACHTAGIPLVIARSMGFIGLCRISSRTHSVIESKPSPAPAEDLRVANPFPELETFVDSIDLPSLDNKDFKHVPYVILLVKMAKEWKATHGGNLPSTIDEKRSFRESIKSLARKPWGEEENLLEAYENAFTAYTARQIPPEVEDIFSDEQCKTGKAHTPSDSFSFEFWIMAKALRDFVQSESDGRLPVSGKVPDMTASTDMFIGLQKVYKEKALADSKAVYDRVLSILRELGLADTAISEDCVATFCQNTCDIRSAHISTLRHEVESNKINAEEIESAVMDGFGDASPHCPLLFYFFIRGCDEFYRKNGRFPGSNGSLELNDEQDALDLLEITKSIVQALSLDTELGLTKGHALEFARYAGTELHNIAAVIGGIASQEAVKLVTHQYSLLNNTYIFNGITCNGNSYQL